MPKRAIGLLLALLALPALPALADHDEARRLLDSGEILPLETVLERARRHTPGDILDVELDEEHGRHIYEILLLDAGGRVWELELDAATGELIEREEEQ
ncbi:MAG: PepSY domain-containing protein [Chromatiales bacterium]|jgi:uncharacterized membrane protein YkoI